MKTLRWVAALLLLSWIVSLPTALGQADKIKGKAKDLKRKVEGTNAPAGKTNAPARR